MRPVQNTVDEIIDLAASEKCSVAVLLRKCLVLANALHNKPLQAWANKELTGYEQDDDELPAYRKVPALAKGFFIGPAGVSINDQPLPPALLGEDHRHFAETAQLVQPIAAYERATAGGRLDWPPNLTALYQRDFYPGYVLNRAWQSIPASVFPGLIDTIKTRVLRFALELKNDLGAVSDDINRLSEDKIDRNVTVNIYGGTNVIASKDFTQVNRIDIEAGDWKGLAEALQAMGVPSAEISDLQSALAADAKDTTVAPVSGGRTAHWLTDFAKNAGHWALKIGVELAQKEVTK